MIVERIRSEFKRRVNKLDSNHNKDYPVAFIDDLYNLKQLEFINLVVGGNSNKLYKEGIETTTLSTDIISNLIEKNKELNPYKLNTNFVEFLLPDNYLHYLDVSIETNCGRFTDLKYNKNLDYDLKISNLKPSKLWKRSLFNIAKSSDKQSTSLYIYKDKFDISKAYLTYVIKPESVFSGGYDTLDFITSGNGLSKTSTKVDSILNDSAANYVIDMMVNELSSNLDNQLGYQLSQQKLINNQ